MDRYDSSRVKRRSERKRSRTEKMAERKERARAKRDADREKRRSVEADREKRRSQEAKARLEALGDDGAAQARRSQAAWEDFVAGGFAGEPAAPVSQKSRPMRPGPMGSGYRKQRLSRRQASGQVRLAKSILLGGVVVAVIAFLAVFWLNRMHSGSTEPAAAGMPPGSPDSQNVILTGTDETGRLNQILVAVRDQGGISLYTIPPRTLAETPENGFQRMDQIPDIGGQQLLDQTVANLLQVPIGYHVSFDYAALEQLSTEAVTINFKTDKPLATADGSVALNPGDNPAGSQRALEILKAASGDGTAGPRIQALFYQGLQAALVGKPEVDRRNIARNLAGRVKTDMGDGFVDFFVQLTTSGQPFGVWPLPVDMKGSGTTWYVEPDLNQLQVLMSGSPADARFTMEIRNGTEEAGVVEAAAERLSSLRFNTTIKPEPSGVDFDFTQIRCGSDALTQGNTIHDLLGAGTVIKDDYMEKEQIIVIIGRDLSLAQLQKPAGPG